MRLRLIYIVLLYLISFCVISTRGFASARSLSQCHIDTLSEGKDSLTAKQLREAVVKADRGWFEADKAVFLPTRKEKNLSNSPASLLKMMHLPMLKEKDEVVTTILGVEVTYFINGIKADKIDMSTFWPKNVRRVEYYENPTDPRFEGVKAAVNFIVPEFAAGGVTKVRLFERMPNNGLLNVSSKVEYKKMAYGIYFQPGYTRTHGTQNEGTEAYNDLYHDGVYYDVINRTFRENSYSRENDIYLVANARYRSEKMRATHTFTLSWDNNLGSGGNSSEVWTNNLFNSSTSANRATGHHTAPALSGDYLFKLSTKWYLFSAWSYSYARAKNVSWSSFTAEDTIINKTHEDVHSANLSLTAMFIPSKKLTFQFRTSSAMDRFVSTYSGTANEKQRQKRQEITSTLKMNWKPVHQFTLTPELGLFSSSWNIGGERHHTIRPTAGLYANANLTKKLSLSGRLSLYTEAPSASSSSNVLVKSTELLWTKGNPDLKNCLSWNTSFGVSYLALNWLDLSFRANYNRIKDDFLTVYTVAPADRGGLIKSERNAQPFNIYGSYIIFDFNFLDRDLKLSLCPNWYHFQANEQKENKFNYFSLDGSLSYTLKKCDFSVDYEGPSKSLNMGGMEKASYHSIWNFSFTYGNGDWHLLVKVEDIFNKKGKKKYTYTSPNYSSYLEKRKWGRCLVLSLTYTFGYGKKVDRSIDISGTSNSKTSIISNDSK